MDDKESGSDIDLSLITQAAVGYVRDNTPSKEAAKKFVAEIKVHLGQILAHMEPSKESPLGNKATSEAVALMEYIAGKKTALESKKGYKPAQASAIVIKDELVPLQVVAGMANDSDMIASVRKVSSHVINELGNEAAEQADPRTLRKRKKRGRAPGSGKKKPA
jgi:hypothetical protein